jgi:hypothetical protein
MAINSIQILKEYSFRIVKKIIENNNLAILTQNDNYRLVYYDGRLVLGQQWL